MATSLKLAVDVLKLITDMNGRQAAIEERRFLGLLPRKVVPFGLSLIHISEPTRPY